MSEDHISFNPETSFGIAPTRQPAAPKVVRLTSGGTITFAKGSDDYEAMPRTGTLSFDLEENGMLYRWTGITPVFDDEAGTATITLPPVRGVKISGGRS